MHAFGQLHLELLDKGSHIAIADHCAFVFLDVEHRLRHHNLQIFLYFHLTAQAPKLLDLFAGEESHFGRQYRTASFHHATFALAAVTLAATGRRQENLLLGQSGHQRVARLDLQRFVIIDGNLHLAFGHEFVAHPKQQGNEQQHDAEENCYAKNYSGSNAHGFKLQCQSTLRPHKAVTIGLLSLGQALCVDSPCAHCDSEQWIVLTNRLRALE